MNKDQRGLLLVLAGLSASGKSYIARHLIDKFGFYHVPSITTRQRRENEIPGIDRIFCSYEEFLSLRNQGRLICESFMFGNWYANDRDMINQYKAGGNIVCQLRFSSIQEMKLEYPDSIVIYIWPANNEIAINLLNSRKIPESERKMRTNEIQEEIDFVNADKRSIKPLIDYHLTNDYSTQILSIIDELISHISRS